MNQLLQEKSNHLKAIFGKREKLDMNSNFRLNNKQNENLINNKDTVIEESNPNKNGLFKSFENQSIEFNSKKEKVHTDTTISSNNINQSLNSNNIQSSLEEIQKNNNSNNVLQELDELIKEFMKETSFRNKSAVLISQHSRQNSEIVQPGLDKALESDDRIIFLKSLNTQGTKHNDNSPIETKQKELTPQNKAIDRSDSIIKKIIQGHKFTTQSPDKKEEEDVINTDEFHTNSPPIQLNDNNKKDLNCPSKIENLINTIPEEDNINKSNDNQKKVSDNHNIEFKLNLDSEPQDKQLTRINNDKDLKENKNLSSREEKEQIPSTKEGNFNML